jgi:hypothetical protein
MFVSIVIIKLILDSGYYCDIIVLFSFNLELCFKTEQLISEPLGELKMYIKSHKKYRKIQL